MRSPRRTAQTASALMVGLALVSAIAVFGASLSRSATSSVDNAIAADLIVTNTNNNGTGQFSNAVATTTATVPGVSATTTVYADQFEFRGALQTLTAVSTPNLGDTVTFRMDAGSTRSLAAGALLVDTTTANNDHLAVGDTATGAVRADRYHSRPDRWDLQAERPDRALRGRRPLTFAPTSRIRCLSRSSSRRAEAPPCRTRSVVLSARTPT